jgi:hypothetical protein
MKEFLNHLVNWGRVKSFLWHAGMMALATFLAYLSDNVGFLQIDGQGAIILGLILAQLSKGFSNFIKDKPLV